MKLFKMLAITALMLFVGVSGANARAHRVAYHGHHHHVIRTVVTVVSPRAVDPITAFFGGLLDAAPVAVQEPAVLVAPHATRREAFNTAPIGEGRLIRATWYGTGRGECTGCNRRRITASGEPLNDRGFTMASSFLRIGTRVRVCAAACQVFRVNDSGGHFDLAKGGAFAIGVRQTRTVRYQILG